MEIQQATGGHGGAELGVFDPHEDDQLARARQLHRLDPEDAGNILVTIAVEDDIPLTKGTVAKLAYQSTYRNFVAVDLFTAMDCVFQQPGDFGFLDVGSSRPLDADPSQYLYDYNDPYHFAERGQTLIRQVVQYYLTRGWDWANTIKEPEAARQKLLARTTAEALQRAKEYKLL